MAFRFVRGGGVNSDPVAFSLPASGVVASGQAVDWLRNGTGGAVVGPSGATSTSTMVFGVALGYAQGASDTFVNVIPFNPGQLWEVDCANAATTAQLGQRHALSASRGYIHNTASDIGSDPTKAARSTAVFLALAMTGSTSGSGKLIGVFTPEITPVIIDTQT